MSFSRRFRAETDYSSGTGSSRFEITPAHSDYNEPDEVGRPIDINICGKFAIKYWEDHADRHIKILEVHSADHSRR